MAILKKPLDSSAHSSYLCGILSLKAAISLTATHSPLPAAFFPTGTCFIKKKKVISSYSSDISKRQSQTHLFQRTQEHLNQLCKVLYFHLQVLSLPCFPFRGTQALHLWETPPPPFSANCRTSRRRGSCFDIHWQLHCSSSSALFVVSARWPPLLKQRSQRWHKGRHSRNTVLWNGKSAMDGGWVTQSRGAWTHLLVGRVIWSPPRTHHTHTHTPNRTGGHLFILDTYIRL